MEDKLQYGTTDLYLYTYIKHYYFISYKNFKSFNLNNISLSWRLEEIKTKLLDGLRRTLNVLLNLTDAYFLLDKII